ncbi:MAG: hypothetical protein QXQ54_08520 [Thermoplasmata archaeon]
MKISKVCVSVERKSFNSDNNESERVSISLTADVESADDYKTVEETLYEECKKFLDAHAKTPTADNKESAAKQIGTEERKNDTETQDVAVKNTTAPAQNTEEIDTNALIQKYQIKSLGHLNYLRAKNKITYKEWCALKPLFK